MKIEFARGQLVYEAAWKGPSFALAKSGAEIVHALHGVFSKRFAVSLADIHVVNATQLSEWVIRLFLNTALWSVEIRFDGYRITCNLITTKEQVQLALECIALTEEVMRSVAPNLTSNAVLGRASVWYWCEGGTKAAQAHLAKFKLSNFKMGSGFEGAEEVTFSVGGGLLSKSEHWAAKFLIEPSTVDAGNMFAMVECRYTEGGKYNSLDERRAHFGRLFDGIVKQAGFELGGVSRG